jgi:hypothetical protein
MGGKSEDSAVFCHSDVDVHHALLVEVEHLRYGIRRHKIAL